MTRRTAWTAAGFVAVLAVVAFFAGSLLTDEPEPTAAPTFAPGTEVPGNILVVTAAGDMRVIRTRDGKVGRTIAKGIGRSLANISASPDGRFAYLDAADGDCRIVQSIDVASGDVETIAPGRSPVVSRDGEDLAFAAPADGCETYDTLVVTSLDAGHERRWSAGKVSEGWGVTYLRWSLDDRSIGATVLRPDGYANKLVDTSAVMGGTLDDEPDIVLAQGSEPVGFLRDGSMLVVATTRERRIIQLQSVADDGEITVLTTRENVGFDLAHLVTDRAGEHILWLERPRSDRKAEGPASLWRFTVGGRRPVRVAKDIVAADWLA